MNAHTKLPSPRLLMCPPQHFAVTYSINPWMDPKEWAQGASALQATATRQWSDLNRVLREQGAAIEMVDAVADLPDLVFTANAAVVLDRKALVARFRHPERQREEPVYTAAFHALKARGLIDGVVAMPEGVALEGAGDCIYDASRRLFWMGCGFRSDAAAAKVVEAEFGVPSIPLTLAEASYYHLDTALCVLPSGAVIYYPGAFTPEALEALHARIPPEQRIALDPEDARRFAANAVCVGRTVVLSSCSEALRRALNAHGYAVVETLLDAFLRSGGSACCLTLRLDRVSHAAQTAEVAVAR